MQIWVIETGEPLPIDQGARLMRAAILTDMLAAYGHKVTWWADAFDHARKTQRFAHPTTINLRDGLELRLLFGPAYTRNITPARFRHNRALARTFKQEIYQRPRPDLIFCCLPTLEMAQQSLEFGRQIKVPVVIDIRDQWPDLYLTILPKPLRRVGQLFLQSEFNRVRWICRNATGLTAVSNTYLNWALSYAGRQRHHQDGVFPLGYRRAVQDEFLVARQTSKLQTRHGIHSNSLIFAFVGIFGASYDLETVIQAARVLPAEEAATVQFVLGGDGDKGLKLRKMAQGLNNVVFTGWLDENSIQGMLHLASVGLAPYVKSALQSLPNKPYEYMASGLPLLSSLRGELEALILKEGIGLQYQAEDVASLVEKIRWLVAHPDERKGMGARARRLFQEQFSVEVIYPRLIEHLEKIARESLTTRKD
jgi:glycosyltransferase involved in cell wall biosynthesis